MIEMPFRSDYDIDDDIDWMDDEDLENFIYTGVSNVNDDEESLEDIEEDQKILPEELDVRPVKKKGAQVASKKDVLKALIQDVSTEPIKDNSSQAS